MREELVDQSRDDIAEESTQFALTEAQKRELDRRIAAQQSNPNRSVPWADVRNRLLGT
jgi:putative addiction module component (TIGR02574 family)